MSFASTIAGSVPTPNRSSRMGRAINGWIIHHNAARDGRGVLEMMRTGSKQVSANYQVLENGDVWGVVPREERSWSASNARWDAESLTFEIANNSGAPGWTISDRAYDRVARTIAEDARWAGIPINRTTVRGHREGSAQGAGGSYATACPGGINLDYLVQLAQHYAEGSTPAGGGATPIPSRKGSNMSQITFYARVDENGNDTGDWTIGGIDLFEDPANDIEVTGYSTHNGWWATNDPQLALMWGRQYSFYPPDTLAVRLQAEDYVRQQWLLERLHEQHYAGLRAALQQG